MLRLSLHASDFAHPTAQTRFDFLAADPLQLDIGLRSIVKRVAGKIRGHRHVEMGVSVADIAPQQIGAAGDIEPQFLAAPQPRRGGRQAERQNHRLIGCQRLPHPRVDGNLAAGTAGWIDPSRAGLMTPIDRR